MGVQLVSFDVFDTLLTRPSGSPETLFLMLGRRLARRDLISSSAQTFAEQRCQAEARRFDNAGGLDSHVTLADILGELTLGLDADPVALAAEELALEKALLRPLPDGVERLGEARSRGVRIAFVSDMYLPEPVLEDLLRSKGLMRDGDLLLVSNRYGASKRSGRLFEVLSSLTGVPPRAIEHHGNDAESDVRQPQRLGVTVRPFATGNPNRYERLLDAGAAQSDGLSAALAGASRLARNGRGELPAHERCIVDISAGVAAPMLIGFVLWVLRRAESAGVRRLYFVSRDGQLLLGVAKILAARIGLSIELRYLYGSRQAWRAPALDLTDAAAVDNVLPMRISGGALESVSAQALFARFGVSPGCVASALAEAGIHEERWSAPLDEARVEAVRSMIRDDVAVRDRLLEAQAANRSLVVDYLRQEGFGDGTPSAIVDLGTGATLYSALADLLEGAGLSVPQAFYLGQRRDGVATLARLPHRYLFDAREERGFCRHSGLIGFLEAVCSADHGSVVGYRRGDRRIEPVTATGGVEEVRQWGHDHVRDTVLATAAELLLDDDHVDWRADVRASTMAAFEAFWLSPTAEEARVWSRFPFDDGWAGHPNWIRLAEPYALVDVLARGYPHRHWWHEAALAMSGAPVRRAFAMRAFAMKAAGRLRRELAARRPASVPAMVPPPAASAAGSAETSVRACADDSPITSPAAACGPTAVPPTDPAIGAAAVPSAAGRSSFGQTPVHTAARAARPVKPYS